MKLIEEYENQSAQPLHYETEQVETMKSKSSLLRKSTKQQGSALVIGLIILLLLTMLGITAMKSSNLQERMAGNLKDSNTAFQSAEAALRQSINSGDVANKSYDGSAAGYGQQITVFKNNNDANVSEYEYWSAHHNWTRESVKATKPAGTNSPPLYYVETIPASTGIWRAGERTKRAYRITAKASGASDRAAAIVQGTILLED